MSLVDCIDTLIAGKYIMGDTCKLNEVVSTITFDRDDLRVYMYYGTDKNYYGDFELLLFDMSQKWYIPIAATFEKKDYPYQNVDKKKFLEIVCNMTSKGNILKEFYNYDMNRTLEVL